MILFDVHAALVTALDAALTTPVFDSFPNTNDDLREFVCVGPGFDSDDAGETVSDWHDAQWGNRAEDGICRVSVVVQTGDDAISAMRTRCGVIVDAILTAITANPSLGVDADRMDPQIMRIETKHRVGVSDYGPYVEAVLSVHYRAIDAY